MKKPQLSVRPRGGAARLLGREVVRLTINPILLALSRELVDYGGGDAPRGKLRGSDLVVRARIRFPGMPLSWAVEGYIALLILKDPLRLRPFSVEPREGLDEATRRFRALPPAAKIHVGERWKRELAALRRAE